MEVVGVDSVHAIFDPMIVVSLLKRARSEAGLTQRALATKAGVPQSTVGRIEAGLIDPKVSTLSKLLGACGYTLEYRRRLGVGVDRSLIRQMLKMTPRERLDSVVSAADALRRLTGKARPR